MVSVSVRLTACIWSGPERTASTATKARHRPSTEARPTGTCQGHINRTRAYYPCRNLRPMTHTPEGCCLYRPLFHRHRHRHVFSNRRPVLIPILRTFSHCTALPRGVPAFVWDLER